MTAKHGKGLWATAGRGLLELSRSQLRGARSALDQLGRKPLGRPLQLGWHTELGRTPLLQGLDLRRGTGAESSEGCRSVVGLLLLNRGEAKLKLGCRLGT